MNVSRTGAIACFSAAALLVTLGVLLAASRFPGGFDWAYTVVSRLASSRQNPEGARWAAASLLAAAVLLWPATHYLARVFAGPDGGDPRLAMGGLRVGLIGAGLLGVEGLLGLQLSRQLRKAHEILAIITFAGMYTGVLGLYLHRIRRSRAYLLPALLVVVPLVAVGVTQLGLYFDQRELGWVNTSWREMGIPFWISFAFWQWLAVALLGLGLGGLIASAHPPRPPSRAAARGPDPSPEPRKTRPRRASARAP